MNLFSRPGILAGLYQYIIFLDWQYLRNLFHSSFCCHAWCKHQGTEKAWKEQQRTITWQRIEGWVWQPQTEVGCYSILEKNRFMNRNNRLMPVLMQQTKTFCLCWSPTHTQGNFVSPAGNYTAVRFTLWKVTNPWVTRAEVSDTACAEHKRWNKRWVMRNWGSLHL